MNLSIRIILLSFFAIIIYCCFISSTNALSEECVPFNTTLSYAVCQPTNLTFSGDSQSDAGNSIAVDMNTLFESFGEENDQNPPVPFACGKAYVAFFCSDYYPACSNPEDAFQDTRACATACQQLVTTCGPYAQYFTAAGLQLPSSSDCSVIYSTDTQKCTYSINNANVLFWYGTNSPTTSGTPSSTTGGSDSYVTINPYPGGALPGGLLAAGLLIILMGLVGLLSLFMKKQERK